MKPEQFLKKSVLYLDNLEEARKLSVAVGLPSERVGSEIYGDGKSILEVGASHEFGIGVPMRSFLKMPLAMKADEIGNAISKQFQLVWSEGRRAPKALGLVGAFARNVILEAFRTSGWGKWPDITQDTKDAKGSSKILIDTGTLRNSITWVVR